MTVTATMTVRSFDLVLPLPHKGTDMRATETAGGCPAGSGAVSRLSDRAGDVESRNGRSTPATTTMPGARTSTTATRTTTTRTTSCVPAPSADQPPPCPADFSFEDLVQAYFDCRRSKRNSPSALAFEARLEDNLRRLAGELEAGTYRPGRSICFVITRPKPREVWAADFRDRVAHHLLYNRIAARFHAGFIADSCACIPGRGTLYGARRLEAKIRSLTQNWQRPAWYLKLDLANFFVSIDKRIVRDLLARRIREPWWLALAETILFHDPRSDVILHSGPAMLAKIPPHKSLFNQPEHLGLPIGNLSSQFFANVYLDALDQHVKHALRCRHYVRYVDDMVLLDEDPQRLAAWRADIAAWLPANLAVRLNPAKTILQPVARGVDFAGHVIKPWRRTLRRRTYNDALQRLAGCPAEGLYETANSYFGLLRQAGHSHADRARLGRLVLRRGHCIDSHLTKTYRTHKETA